MTTLSVPRFRLTLAAIFCGAVALFMILLARTAHADPVVVAQATADSGWDLLEQHGPWWGGTLLAFGMLSAFLRRNDSSHWIARGRVLSSLAGAAMVLEAVLGWHLNGAPSAGIAVAVFAAFNLILHSTVAGPAAPTSTGRATAGSVMLVLCVLLAAGCAGSQVRARGAAGAGAFIDCETPQLTVAAAALGNIAKVAVLSTISGNGHVDTAALKDALAGIKDAAMMCAVDAAIVAAATPVPPQPGAAMAAGLEVQGDELRAQYAAVKAELGWPVMKGAVE